MAVVVVESPAKARTVGRFLGRGYTVKASVGHVRDLLKSKLSVDVENDFEPRYTVPRDKKKIVKELSLAVDKAAEVYLATDPDREGNNIVCIEERFPGGFFSGVDTIATTSYRGITVREEVRD